MYITLQIYFLHLPMQATRPNAKELIKLEELVHGCANAAEYITSKNAVLRTVGAVCQDFQQVPVLKLADDSAC